MTQRERLTKAELGVLAMTARLTFPDGSGLGAFLMGANLRTGNRLADRGLVDRCAGWPAISYARITDAGRRALEDGST